MSGQASEPGIDRIDGLGHGIEVATLNDLLDQSQLFVGDARSGIPDRDTGRDIGHAGGIGAEFLQGQVGIGRLVGSIGVHQSRRLVGHHFFENRGDGFAFGKPLAADPGQQPRRLKLVEQDGAGAPAIGKRQPVHFIKKARCRRTRKSDDGKDPQMLITQTRLGRRSKECARPRGCHRPAAPCQPRPRSGNRR